MTALDHHTHRVAGLRGSRTLEWLVALLATVASAALGVSAAHAAGGPGGSTASIATSDPTVGLVTGSAKSTAASTAAPSAAARSRAPGKGTQPQATIITPEASNFSIARPAYRAPAPLARYQPADQPIVSTIHRAPPPATVTLLASGGASLVAASGPIATSTPNRPHPAAPTGTAAGRWVLPARPAPMLLQRNMPVLVRVSVPLVGVYISSHTNTLSRGMSVPRPGSNSTRLPAQRVGPSGLVSTTASAFTPDLLRTPGGITVLLGSNPFSTSGTSGVTLLGLSGMLAAMTLLAGVPWRRRSWDLRVFSGESALLSLAIDRPG